MAHPLPSFVCEVLGTMSQRTVEILIGRLLTDEELRQRFLDQPFETLASLCQLGYELSRGEIDALIATDTGMWTWSAERINPRLQRCSLRNA
jgi:hypothetical protein